MTRVRACRPTPPDPQVLQHRKLGLRLLLFKRPNFSSFFAFEMFDLVHIGAVSFSVFLLLFQIHGPMCREEIT